MTPLIRQLLAAAALSLATGACVAQAATAAAEPAPKGPPAGFVAPADPKPDEGNADRARSQPGRLLVPGWTPDSRTAPSRAC
jgi:formate dehydrogenase subunit gamma